MKKELKETGFNKKINDLRTARKSILTGESDDPMRDLKKLIRVLKRLKGSWILDGYTRDIIDRFIEVLEEDISLL